MKRNIFRFVAAIVVLTCLSGMARAGDNPNDPAEGWNRFMFAVNEGLDKTVAKPLAKGYDYVAPLPVRVGVGNFFSNIADVLIGANSLLQGKPKDALSDWGRFLINTTLGIGGVFDVATEMGIEKHNEDFGQTLAVWGVGEGPYLFWPIIGPRTTRDTFGWAVDSRFEPVWHSYPINMRNTAVATRFIDIRAALLPTDAVIEQGAMDKYSYIRDAYLQMRRNDVYDGNPPREKPPAETNSDTVTESVESVKVQSKSVIE